MDPKKKDNLIDRYINLNMTAEEQQAFTEEISRNPDLKKEVETRMLLVEGLRMNAEKELLQTVTPSRKSIYKRLYMPLLAAGILLFILIGILGRKTYTTDLEALYAQYYHRPVIETVRGNDFPNPEAAAVNLRIARYYRLHQSDSLLNLFQHIPAENAIGLLSATSRLYLGVTLLENGKPEACIKVLSPLQDSDYRETALWLQLFCQLRLGHKESALQIAEQLMQTTGFYQQQALEIYNKLH